MALKLSHRANLLIPKPQRASAPGGADLDRPLRFDRRRESRASTAGWARVICLDPFKSFLGGTAELADISPSGLGLRCERAIPVGEYVEVRLAPFRVRGRIAQVVRCEEIPAQIDSATGAVIQPRHFRIGLRHAAAVRAA